MTDEIKGMKILSPEGRNEKVLEIQVKIEGQDRIVQLALDEILEFALKDQVVAKALTGIHCTLNSMNGHLGEIRKYFEGQKKDQTG